MILCVFTASGGPMSIIMKMICNGILLHILYFFHLNNGKWSCFHSCFKFNKLLSLLFKFPTAPLFKMEQRFRLWSAFWTTTVSCENKTKTKKRISYMAYSYMRCWTFSHQSVLRYLVCEFLVLVSYIWEYSGFSTS